MHYRNKLTPRAFVGDRRCWICLCGGNLTQICACRGDAGYVHVNCLVNMAASKSNKLGEQRRETSDQFQELRSVWNVCDNCKQRYVGEVKQSMVNEFLLIINNAYRKKDHWSCFEYQDSRVLTLLAKSEVLDAYSDSEKTEITYEK